jgi:hypothetical protein
MTDPPRNEKNKRFTFNQRGEASPHNMSGVLAPHAGGNKNKSPTNVIVGLSLYL